MSTRLRLHWLPLLLNLAGCVAFVALREPLPASYFAEIDANREAAWRVGGIAIEGNSAISAVVAGRVVSPWSRYHGGESLFVKILEVANIPAIAAMLSFELTAGLVLHMHTRAESWALAVVFVVASSIQWYLVGTILRSRFEKRR